MLTAISPSTPTNIDTGALSAMVAPRNALVNLTAAAAATCTLVN